MVRRAICVSTGVKESQSVLYYSIDSIGTVAIAYEKYLPAKYSSSALLAMHDAL